MPAHRVENATTTELRDEAINARHHEVARMVVLGFKDIDIAKILGVSTRMVQYTKASPKIKEQMHYLMGAEDKKTVDVAVQIKEYAPKCLKVLQNIIDDDGASDHLRSKNALALMAIAGHSPTKQINVAHAHLSVDQIDRIKERALQIGMDAGTIVEGEVVD